MRVEGGDKVERSTLTVDCTEADFRTLETALYQVCVQDNNNNYKVREDLRLGI